jgi:hypothetical protein
MTDAELRAVLASNLIRTPRIAKMIAWQEELTQALAALTPDEQRAARELARTSPLSILQAVNAVKARRR